MCIDKVIEFCSPTLAGLKSASLFNMTFDDGEALFDEIDSLNSMCNCKDLYFRVLKCTGVKALILVYRKSYLNDILNDSDAVRILASCGYESLELDDALSMLTSRIKSDSFPHEIGIFLGYPVVDVKGYIENRGKNYICCGQWKVYGDKEAAIKLFNKYKKCSRIYLDRYSKGYSLNKLVVAA